MLNRFYLILFIFFVSVSLNAETISGNCAIQDKPFGENQFQLNTGTKVDCSIPQKGWCMILYKAFVDKKYVYDGIKILANARIRNEFGKNIGRVFMDMNPYRTITENDTCFIMEIAGYIEASCIEDTSVVEHELEKMYVKNDSLFSISSFNKHLHDFNYVQWISTENLYSYLLKETDIVNPKPGLRVVIIFDRDKAIAILHKRNLRIRNFESNTTTQKYSLVYLSNFNEAYKKKVSEKFLHFANDL
jgi:hypothetical protein